MTPLEYIGAAFLGVLVIATLLLTPRIYRGAVYWCWAWVAQIITGLTFAAGAPIAGVMLSTLFPLLLVAGTLEFAGRPMPVWFLPVVTGVALCKGSLTAFDMVLPTIIIETLYESSAYLYSIFLIKEEKHASSPVRVSLITAFVLITLLELYSSTLELLGDVFYIDWTLWAIIAVPVSGAQLVAWFERQQINRESETGRQHDAREAAEERFRALVVKSRDIIIEIDSAGRLIYVSPNTEKVLGFNADALIGINIARLVQATGTIATNPGTMPDLALPLADLVSAGPYGRDYKIINASGEERWLEIDASRFDTSSGELRAIGVVRDVTERRHFENQLATGHKLESLGVLAAGVAHDFNNLLTNVLTNAELAQDDIKSGRLDGADGRIVALQMAVLQAKSLTQQLMTYAGKGAATPTLVHINDEIDKTRDLINASIGDEVKLTVLLGEGLPATRIDPVQLQQIIINLVVNARDACTTHGLVSLETLLVHELPPAAKSTAVGAPPYVAFRVADNGCGMTAEVRSRVFDPFFTTKFDGRGLGLASVFGIVRMHDGAITVDSNPGNGACFTIYLPASEELPVEPPAESVLGAAPASGAILLVDDAETPLELLAEALSRNHFTVFTALDGTLAIERLAKEPTIKLVLLDLAMPGINGAELILALRRTSADVLIVIMSGYNKTIALEKLAGVEVEGFLQKPFRTTELLQMVNRFLT